MNTRKYLPDTRSSVTKKFSVGELELYVTVGFYDNQQPGEIFVVVAKHGSTLAGIVDAWAVAVSLLLQHGLPWNVIEKKFSSARFEPYDDRYSSPIDGLVKNIGKLISEFGGLPDVDYNGKEETKAS